MEKDTYIRQLFQKFLENRHSSAELEELLSFFDLDAKDSGKLSDFVANVVSGDFDREDFLERDHHAVYTEEIDRIGARVKLKLAEELAPSPAVQRIADRSPWKISRRLAAAAVVLIFASVTFFLLKTGLNEETGPTAWSIDEPIATGNRATLLLGDGSEVNLDENQQGIVVTDGITYLDGTLLVSADKISEKWLTLQTPEGGTYRVTLPDGTSVWLNAGSSLRYPVRFSAHERLVELDGEAYFDVVTNGSSFKVISNGQTVEVLGTQFNIYAYSAETASHTTLVEGSVAVYPQKRSPSDPQNVNILKPGQQALIRSGELTVRPVETRAFTAWIEGRFTFDGKPFEQIMQELGRWYGFDVHYEGRIPEDRFMGGAFRTDRIATALQFLESSDIRYRLEKDERGRRQLIIGDTE